ncbi:MAG: N-formylglutamate deformylase [Phyllobacteriaceae bacterium]|nr:N-formylglutamate deformylase [Phyllobacteriaceae bacterium]
MLPFAVIEGDSPVILGQPHGGTFVPDDVAAHLNANGRLLADTDWHIGRLYDGLLTSATIVRANFHRYVIDANRDPEGGSLYPGQNTTGLVPLTDFDGAPIWRTLPDEAEIGRRIKAFHAPYHKAIQAQIARVKAQHGFALIYDCHSIRSRIPFLFDGTLPDLNIGTDNGATCDARLAGAVLAHAEASPYSCVMNGRFRGGWTTRHYGQPKTGVHAIQMEIAQSAYLETETAPFAYSPSKAERLRPVLAAILQSLRSSHHDSQSPPQYA